MDEVGTRLMSSLREKFRERKLAQWGLGYVAGAFVVLQALDALAEPMGLSLFLQQAVLVLIVMGLPVALVLAWFHGEEGAQRITVTEGAMLGSLALVSAVVLYGMRTSAPSGDVALERPVDLGAPASATREISIAVLPFDELTLPNDALRLPDAIHDQILTHLVQVPGLNAKARTSVLALSDLTLTTRQIADTLGADYVLEGSLQFVDPIVRVNAQLIEPTTDDHVWGGNRDFELRDFFALQEEVADWVAQEVQRVLGGPTFATVHNPVVNPEAHELYLNGRIYANSRTEVGFTQAISAFEEALTLDPEHSQALSSLALTFALWGHYGYGGHNASYETFGRAIGLADRAVNLDPDLAAAHATRGYLLAKALAPADSVEPAFLRALELAPGSSDAHILYAGFLARESRFEESIRESRIAIDLDPIAPGRDSGLGYNALAAGDLDLAISASQRASALEPGLLAPRVIRALALVQLGRLEECLEIDLGPYAAVRAICLHSAGSSEEAVDLVASVPASGGPRNAVLHLATYHAWTGNTERTLEALRRAYEDSPHGLDYRVVASGLFDPVRNDPAFTAGLERLRQTVWSRVQEASGG